jgi:hypothetical protein
VFSYQNESSLANEAKWPLSDGRWKPVNNHLCRHQGPDNRTALFE